MEVTKVGASVTLPTSGPWEVGQDFLVLKMFVSMAPPTPRQEMGFTESSAVSPGPLGARAGFGRRMGRHRIVSTARIRAQLCRRSDVNPRSTLGTGWELSV